MRRIEIIKKVVTSIEGNSEFAFLPLSMDVTHRRQHEVKRKHIPQRYVFINL